MSWHDYGFRDVVEVDVDVGWETRWVWGRKWNEVTGLLSRAGQFMGVKL